MYNEGQHDGESGCTCSASCCKDATYFPIQVTDSSTLLKTNRLQGNKWQQFNSEWFKMYPWLVLCTTRPSVHTVGTVM